MARGRYLGRLKLRPLPAELAQQYLLQWHPRQLALQPESFPPLTSPALFGNAAPLAVEIGAGSGEYLLSLAQAAPQSNFLGIEISNRAAHAAAWAAAEAGQANMKVLRADFKLLAPLVRPGAWQRAYLHFPDPLLKPADARRILFAAPFLDLLALALPPGGELSVVSDQAAFFEYMLALAEADERFVKAHAAAYLSGFSPPVKSRFQRIWERKGRTPRQFVLRRR
ncbi:MAG: hypothetical protein KF821_09690 [Anaerolineales bacterium]|jgi:tRNA (guanine-N7-)-methyltransferase|nr:hypothetical protein [Anaerolineales bacterium]MBX3006081.1 hypothetical protein [Anaerolineales bacterium]